MDILRFDTAVSNKFKLMNATNGGPWHKRHATDQWRTNFEDYKAARIPYSRNHDSWACGSTYGGPYSHDISAIFPNFDADPYDSNSYDFACTDESIFVTSEAGTKTFFRLGETIEHHIKKHHTLPPKDFKKWAIICEHIIKHYNYGWADGYYLNMEYWEIWNEPDLDPEGSDNKRTWGGTKSQFFDLYEIAATHLKSCFPKLKIGGPAIAGNEEWAADFLSEMAKRNVPLDFFSWHIYCTEPRYIAEKADRIRKMLDRNGYCDTESILNEWNYVKNWEDKYVYSLKAIHGMKGASFTMASITAAQHSSIDMMMYYDTRPSVFCGAFDYYTYEPLKGYYPLMWYGKLYDMKGEILCESQIENIYTLCGKNEEGKTLTIVTYYSDDDTLPPKEVLFQFPEKGRYNVYRLDEKNSSALTEITEDLHFTLNVNTCLLLEQI